jgi:hypothetical protein
VAGAELHARDGQRRLLDHDRRRTAGRDELVERAAAEREGERIANCRADILELGARLGRAEDDVLRGWVCDDDPGVCQERDTRHASMLWVSAIVCQGIATTA